ncbi:hypothetical protein N656DRAFT_703605 [Canariomyces notabilis]|uniref:Uncharacterized protein n=1 Tax=Canariomyces notabilis TaxID=2074819 RepID=A0AAN6TID5_9PEZI|nr:hypothetical protein N656DRAFT_703605 [Canariomyces arenarius]
MVTASLGVAGARQSHISEAYKPSDSDNPQPSRDLPIPLSRFCPDYVWQPVCNHSTMTSLYQEEYRCESCHRWPPFGFLYRCTIDRDPLLLFAKNKGFEVAFDDIGHKFVEEMTLGKFGADARSEKYSLLKEMSEEQLCSYTPQQLSVLLSQRENVHKAIADERCRTDHPNFPYARRKYPSDKIPWVPDPKFECRRKLCARCHKFGRDKSYLSLNSILSGDILPTVAVSFSFGHMGSRPYCDADVVKNLGYRPVPLVRIQTAPPLSKALA